MAIDAFIVALVTPFLIWALVAVMARKDPRLLERIYPAVKNIAWAMYGGWIVLLLFAIGESIDRKISGIGFTLYSGVNLMCGWIRRRVEPEADPAASEGWWPTPKDY